MDADERRLGRRVWWAATAQVASSATNLALYVGLLASTDTNRFGRFVAVLGVYHLALALSRSLISEPLVANGRLGGDAGRDFSWAWARRRHGAIGLTAAGLTVIVGRLVEADGPTTAAVAVALPALIAQDGVRNLAWSAGRPRVAVALDGLWLAASGIGLAALVAGGPVEPEPVVLAWLGGGLISAAVAAVLARRLATTVVGTAETAGTAPARWPVEARRLHQRRRSHGLLIAARNVLPIVVATVVDPSAAGLLKAALLPFTPMLTLFAGLRLVVLPAMQRAAEAGSRPGDEPASTALDRFVLRLVCWYGVGASAIAAATVAAVATVADPVHLGETAEVVGWGAVVAVTTVVIRPLAEGIGFGRRPVGPVRLRLAELALEWAGVFLAVAVAGPSAVVVGWATGMALGGLVWVAAGVIGGGEHRPSISSAAAATADTVAGRARVSPAATTGGPSAPADRRAG